MPVPGPQSADPPAEVPKRFQLSADVAQILECLEAGPELLRFAQIGINGAEVPDCIQGSVEFLDGRFSRAGRGDAAHEIVYRRQGLARDQPEVEIERAPVR